MQWLIFVLMLIPSIVIAEPARPVSELEQSFRSCSMITSELLTALQFHQKGLVLEELRDALPTDSKNAFDRIRQVYEIAEKQGLQASFQTLNELYQRCAKEVYDRNGKPPRNSLEYGFYYCSGENKLRFTVLNARAQNLPLDKALETMPKARHQMTQDLYKLVDQQGIIPGFDHSANELKSCLNQVLGIRS